MGFSITAANLSWINGAKDDPEDLCLHGHAVACIADKVLEYDATISAAALYLLKSLTEDHIIYQDNQMLPCCGFMLITDDDLNSVTICGCPNGIDWSVKHDKNDVILELADGTTERIPLEEYTAEVFRFADMAEDFYRSCSPKILPDDSSVRDGYTAFWNEWHRRRGHGKVLPSYMIVHDTDILAVNRSKKENAEDSIIYKDKNGVGHTIDLDVCAKNYSEINNCGNGLIGERNIVEYSVVFYTTGILTKIIFDKPYVFRFGCCSGLYGSRARRFLLFEKLLDETKYKTRDLS